MTGGRETKEEREERLAKALRENLRRRKGQARAKAEASSAETRTDERPS